jgi:hypothetical protein
VEAEHDRARQRLSLRLGAALVLEHVEIGGEARGHAQRLAEQASDDLELRLTPIFAVP